MSYLIANWQAPNNIKALSTTKLGGVSIGAYCSNNLGLHVNDNPKHVLQNRDNLKQNLNLANEPFWLEQTHSKICTLANNYNDSRNADAAVTKNRELPLAILTADCVPIVICNIQGDEIAAIHAGWKGLVTGIIENTVAKLSRTAENYMAWIGPAICQKCYATSNEVYQNFILRYNFLEAAFMHANEQCFANLPQIAQLILNKLGITQVNLSNACTFEENNKYYSYRREAQTGRIATLIWFQG